MGNFQQTYAKLRDDQLIRLAKERDTLLIEGQEALDAEIAKRGLLGREPEESPEESTPSLLPASRRSPWRLVGTIVKYIVFLILARFVYSSELVWLFFKRAWVLIVLFVITALIGAGIGGWYRSRPSPNPKVAGFFAWLCLFAWVLPIFGLFIAVIAYRMSPIAARPIRARWSASIGLILSLVFAGYSAYLRYAR